MNTQKWSTDIPTESGWYWAKRNVAECPEINNVPFIVWVSSDMRLRFGRHEHGFHVADVGFAFWCGPLVPPNAELKGGA